MTVRLIICIKLKRDRRLNIFSDSTAVYILRSSPVKIIVCSIPQQNMPDCIIMLPDDWSSSYYSLSSTNTSDAGYTSNKINAADWAASLEAHGAVFLPAAGYRNGSSVINPNDNGCYWSSTASGADDTYRLSFSSSNVDSSSSDHRFYGHSVRLVAVVK